MVDAVGPMKEPVKVTKWHKVPTEKVEKDKYSTHNRSNIFNNSCTLYKQENQQQQ